jgi:DNA-binding MarR family transcriptional regulator
VDAPTASRVLGALIARRLVRAEDDPEDRRRTRLRLTATGRELAQTLAGDAAEIRRGLVAGMSAPEVDALRMGLRKVIENMGRLSTAPGEPE